MSGRRAVESGLLLVAQAESKCGRITNPAAIFYFSLSFKYMQFTAGHYWEPGALAE
jgi:hypothetical protein